MVTKEEALKLALEALEYMDGHYLSLPQQGMQALTAIKEALAQPAQEPTVIPLESSQEAADAIERMLAEYNYPANPANVARAGWRAARLYKAAQPAQEPVAWGYRSKDGEIYDCISPETHAYTKGDYDVPLYTTPPQRPWVELTDEELNILWDEWKDAVCLDHKTWAQAIEAKLKEKNT